MLLRAWALRPQRSWLNTLIGPLVAAYGATAVWSSRPAWSAELPVPCVAGACGPTTWVSSGAATQTILGNTATIRQTTDQVTLNWRSFNVSADGRVEFQQPDSSSVALNRILDSSPSRIFGAITANGRIYLINQNGILFGAGSQVNVGGLIAASLDITPDAIANGLTQPQETGAPAFEAFAEGSAPIRVEAGAYIKSANGQVLLLAPEVSNLGTIDTPDGQTILAAGQQIFIAPDPEIRGLKVEVGSGGVVTNGEAANASRSAQDVLGRITAERGNVTLAAYAVNQQGRISATTSVRSNGTIRLQARDTPSDQLPGAGNFSVPRGGELVLGANSITEVTLPETDTDTTVDINPQLHSSIEASGRLVSVLSGARLIASGGNITIEAAEDLSVDLKNVTAPDTSRVFIDNDAILDVSGAHISLPVERNSLRVELRGSQVQNSPLQRDGALRGETVYVDVRRSGTLADGTPWVGSPIADLQGDVSTIQRNVRERNLAGGQIVVESQGAVLVARDATLDVSGGVIDWQSGYVKTSQLRGADGRLYDIGVADRDRVYTGVANGLTIKDQRWGTESTYRLQGSGQQAQFEAGYQQGQDAGGVSIAAPQSVFDGLIDGTTVAGFYQRTPASTSAGNVRPHAEVPVGASLSVGTPLSTGTTSNFVASNITIGSGYAIPAFGTGTGSTFDPLRDPLPTEVASTTHVRIELLHPNTVSRLAVYGNGSVSLASDMTLPVGGALTLRGGRIVLDHDIDVPSGVIDIGVEKTTEFTGDGDAIPRLEVHESVDLLARGQWVNENPQLDAGTRAPVFINGGSVALRANPGDLLIDPNTTIDVSAGARRRVSGAIDAGRGGAVTLLAATVVPTDPVQFTLGAELRGYALENGGSLSITANSICVSASECTEEHALTLTPEWSRSGGFGSITLASNFDDLTVAGDATLDLRQRNYQFAANPALAPSGTSFSDLIAVADLPDDRRRAMNLALRAGMAPSGIQFADLVLETGSRIIADPLASIALESDSRVLMDGQVRAPGGTVSLRLSGSVGNFEPDRGIWLGDAARLNVAGTTQFTPSDLGLRLGSVLAGGTVNINSGGGYIVTAPGSVIDVSGTAAELDTLASGNMYSRRTVASGAGSIAFASPDGMLLNGTLLGHPGGEQASGGRLTVTIDPGEGARRLDRGPVGDRSILVSRSQAPIVVGPGVEMPSAYDGIVRLSASQATDGGFDFVTLTAGNMLFTDPNDPTGSPVPQLGGYGRIVFDSDVTLAPRAGLVVNAPVVTVDGTGAATLRSAYVALGNATSATSQSLRQETVAAEAGTGQLRVDAGFLDIVGNVSLSGLSDVQLSSAGDIRFRGVYSPAAKEYVGTLNAAAPIQFTAAQIYPSTLTDYTVAVAGTPDARITVLRSAGAADDVLSAAGRLRLQADEVSIAGTVRAPMGEVIIDADRAEVLAGGVVSSSLDGLTVPFGTTQGGLSWAYRLASDLTRIYGTDGQVVPQQSVRFDADTVDLAPGSVIDVSGGGDLMAYEFLPGLGGTKDVLGATNQFAVLRGLSLDVAPYDPAEYANSPLRPGQSVHLHAGSGLPEGDYVLLPARYALLPGAYLVAPVTGYQDISPSDSYRRLDGSVIVAGVNTWSGTAIRDSRTSGFAVRPGSAALNEARYTTTSANQFFAAQATEADVSVPRVPADAGTATFLTRQQLALNGLLRADHASGRRGGVVELSSSRIRIESDTTSDVPGFLAVSAEQLSSFGAESLVIGGVRHATADGVELQTAAEEVVVASGTQITAPEIILTASGALTIEENARVTAAGTAVAQADSSLQMEGGSVLLRAATGEQIAITRTEDAMATPGTLVLANGSVIGASGSITLDVPGSAVTSGAFDIAGGSLALGSQRIGLGSAPANFEGLTFDPATLGASAVGELVLRGREAIDLFGAVDLTTAQLVLDSPLLRAGSAGTAGRLRADRIELGNSTGASATTPTVGDGALELQATNIDLAQGTLGISGFATTVLGAADTIRATADGGLTTAGDLALSAAAITTTSGDDYAITAAGRMDITRSATASATQIDSLGGSLSFTAAQIAHTGNIVVPAGRAEFLANTGDLQLGETAVIDVSGRVVDFAGTPVAAAGGHVSLVAAAGNVAAASGSSIDVSGAGTEGIAGSIDIRAESGTAALAGTLHGSGSAADRGGSASIAAQSFDFDAVRAQLTAGGFTGAWNLWLQGAGDLVLASDATIKARSLRLTADQGAITVNGTIDASTRRGGAVTLAARDAITLNGRIDAHATDADVRGGRVELDSATAVLLHAGSSIDVSGTTLSDPALTRGGTVLLRLPQAAALSVVDTPQAARLAVAGTITGAREVGIEGYAVYDDADGVIDANEVLADPSNPWFNDAATFANRAAEIQNALGVTAEDGYFVRSGVEVRSGGDLQLDADWNLYDWRFNGEPGVLTLRAQGNLIFARSLSDGFATVSTFTLPTRDQAGPSWSYRLVGGARTDSADPLAVRSTLAPVAGTGGNVEVVAGTPGVRTGTAVFRMVRTGTGRIDVAAAQNFVLGNQASVLYTAGVAGPGFAMTDALASGGLGGLAYPIDGGDISIVAGQDVMGAPTGQFVTDWQARSGRPHPTIENQTRATAWSIMFSRFEQGVATLGGGSVDVLAGRDIVNLSASTPSVGRQVGGRLLADSVVQQSGGGDLTISAGADIVGGKFTVDRGEASIVAGGSLLSAAADGMNLAQAALLGLGDSRIDVRARDSVAVAAIVNPTLLPASTRLVGSSTIFSTYTPDSAVSISAAGGDLRLMGDPRSQMQNFPTADPQALPLRIAAPTLRAATMSGSLELAKSISLWPAPRGNLELFARQDLNLVTLDNQYQITVSDADVASFPSVSAPALATLLNPSDNSPFVALSDAPNSRFFNAAAPVHGAQAAEDGTSDPTPVRLVALEGDIAMNSLNVGGSVYSPKAVDVYAGRDILNLGLRIQHVDAADVSTLEAGRDITYVTSRTAAGEIASNSQEIVIAGPGVLQLQAGRNVDLQASSGITSEGNLRNSALPDQGAAISVLAGLNGRTPALAEFATRYLAQSTQYDSELIRFVEQTTDAGNLDKDDALALFNALPPERRRVLLESVLLAELRAGGTEGASPGDKHGDYTRAFAALETYFPGSNPDPDAGQTNAYDGDIRLFFSRIYTLSGGDISLLAPGGEVNVGLATPPTAFGVSKNPEQLGIVAQSTGSISSVSYDDFQVNESRAFAADGGDILVWSTRGDIDAGRGAKTAISAPPPTVTIDANGNTVVKFPAALAGSGIQTLASTPGRKPGNVALFAPRGVVNASDAGIVAGNLTIGATAVLGVDNIKVTGVSVGVPVDAGGLGSALAGVSNVASSASAAAAAALESGQSQDNDQASLADTALSWLDVFIVGLGEDTCKQDDVACLKRQKAQ